MEQSVLNVVRSFPKAPVIEVCVALVAVAEAARGWTFESEQEQSLSPFLLEAAAKLTLDLYEIGFTHQNAVTCEVLLDHWNMISGPPLSKNVSRTF